MNYKPLLAAGTLLGIGLGGFVDGIIFHQVLQLHSMLSAKLPQDNLVNVKVSMVWDGLFHAFTWVATAVGIRMLWHAGTISNCPWSGKMMWGALLIGWGTFNLVEGIIDHHLINIHHVVELLGTSIYDYIFLATGIILIGVGLMITRQAKSNQASVHSLSELKH
ncbi:MAG: DUF2243 domain-containing protein [Ferruginibacter sp.]